VALTLWTLPEITVTVNTVTILDEAGAEAIVASVWPAARVVGDPQPLTGGFWASMFRLELAGQPAGVPASVVLRLAPDHAMGAKELAVQQVVAEQGYPTPAIRARGVDGNGRPWALMDFVDGAPPLDGLDGLAAVRRAPRLLGSLPAEMATAVARLHQLDPEPVTAAVRAAAPSVAWHVDELLGHFEAGARAVDRAELKSAVAALADSRPRERTTVVCHGDFHPFNLLACRDRSTTVIDWTGALCAEPAFDLAFTVLLLSNPPLHAGGLLRPVVGTAGGLLARLFLKGYRRANPAADLSNLDWYRALHGARVLIELARIEDEFGPGGAGHPFAAMVGPATAAVDAATGTTLARCC
jgi:aminoglycoside phosphotransferase (APT) family kinase protein